MENIPEQMQAFVCTGVASPDLQASIQTIPVPQPKQGYVLIKVDSSPINPSDFYTMRGVFKQVPCVVGLEGSGIVVKSGGGELADSLVGKRVAAVSEWEYDGFWSEYTVVNSEKAVVVADDVSLPVAANSYINPMTVRGFMEIIRQGGYTSALNTAASSQLGQMFIIQCKNAGVKSVNIVRRDIHIQKLKDLGADYVLCTSSENFQQELNQLCQELQLKIAFDCCGGDMVTQLMIALTSGSKLYVYGLLNGPIIQNFDIAPMLWKDVQLCAFLVQNYGYQRLDILDQSTVEQFPTVIRGEIKLEDIVAASEQYHNDMSSGKFVIRL